MQLHIDVDATKTIALIESMRADLAALKQIPEFPVDELLRLGDGLLSHLAYLQLRKPAALPAAQPAP